MEQVTERFTGKVSGRNMVSNGIYGMIGKRGRYFVGEAIDKLAEYETAEEEGRLVVLPCNVGDTVYIIRDDCDFPYDCYQSRACNRCAYRNLYVDEEVFSLVDIVTNLEVFGITIFLTHEKAERALEEMKNE